MDVAAPLSDAVKNTIGSQLTHKVREWILTGQLQPGSKINLERLREGLQVSLSPLREALARLTSEGLVEFADNRGYWVTPVSVANLEEITRLRMEFECLALEKAIAIADVNWESQVMRALHRLNRTVRDAEQPETLAQWELAHANLHETLISGCGMPTLLNFCRVLMSQNDRYRRIFLKSQSQGDRNTRGEHSEIAEAAVARDAECAKSRLRNHLERTGSNLKNHLIELGT